MAVSFSVGAVSLPGSYTTEWNFTTHDGTAPSTPGTPDMDSGSDNGSSQTDTGLTIH